MKMSQAFPSKYLKAADLNDQAHLLTMREVAMEKISETDQKPVLYFQGADKGIVLNRTNADTIALAYGDDSDGWIGKPIEVFPSTVMFNNAVVPCIRVRKPMTQAQAPLGGAAPNTESGDPGAGLDDEIPF